MPGTSEFTQAFFDASCKAWKENKLRYGQAMYKYKKNAFSVPNDLPTCKVSSAVQKKNNKEISMRQEIDEVAPLRERRSARLRQLHLAQTYSNLNGENDA